MKFREHHLQKILTSFDPQKSPLDVFLSTYFRSNKAVGSKDRKHLSELIYKQLRWKALFDYLKIPLETFNPLEHLGDETIPAFIRYSIPEELYEQLLLFYGKKRTEELALISNERAPTVLRVNTLKISRDQLWERWKDQYAVEKTSTSAVGLTFKEKINFFALPEFKEGLFEIQDEASQLAAHLVEAKPKQHVLDFCAGAGGKTLAFAPFLQHTGQIYLHDIRPHALLEAKKRLNRAGIQNAQFKISSSLKGHMDWVLVDVPCTGSGTYRRNPDLKWKFSNTLLKRITQEQRQIFEQALTYLKPKVRIVYVTCSILPPENEEQIAFFQSHFSLRSIKTFQTFPTPGGMDGFFGAVLEKI